MVQEVQNGTDSEGMSIPTPKQVSQDSPAAGRRSGQDKEAWSKGQGASAFVSNYGETSGEEVEVGNSIGFY